MTKHSSTAAWQMLLAGVSGFGLTYLLASRALDTGSWWQYGGTLVLLGFSIRIMVMSFHTRKKHEQ